jgi:two-component system alkaline phosphatase synthesis response regulator PhoP
MSDVHEMPTIVLADDEPDLLLLVTLRLRKQGYTVLCATDGQHALELIEANSPQMAVLDIMMPRLTGIQVLDRLRHDPATEDMLVMLMSAGFAGEADADGVPIGADDFLNKPFPAGEICHRVKALFEHGRSQIA